jgi:hypothetical protein
VPALRAYAPQDCYLPGPSIPAEGVPALRAYAAIGCYLPGPSTPAEGVPALRAYELQDCYLPGPSTPAEGVPALRAYGPQDCCFPGPSTPALFRRPYPIVRPLRIQKAVRGYREQERRDKADTVIVQAVRRRVRVELLGTIALHAYW